MLVGPQGDQGADPAELRSKLAHNRTLDLSFASSPGTHPQRLHLVEEGLRAGRRLAISRICSHQEAPTRRGALNETSPAETVNATHSQPLSRDGRQCDARTDSDEHGD